MKKILLFSILILAGISAVAQDSLPLTEKGGLYRVTLKVNGHETTLLLDTGASISLISPEALGLSKMEVAHLETVSAQGLVIGNSIPISRVQLHVGSGFFSAEVGVLRIPALKDCDGILGSDILSQFKNVSIDYKHKTLTLTR